MKISNSIKKHRQEQNITQAELASDLNFTQSYVSQVEKGNQIPSLETAFRISEYFGLEVNQVFNSDRE